MTVYIINKIYLNSSLIRKSNFFSEIYGNKTYNLIYVLYFFDRLYILMRCFCTRNNFFIGGLYAKYNLCCQLDVGNALLGMVITFAETVLGQL